MDLIRFVNISRRAVLGKSFKDEKITFRALNDSYFKCKNVKGFDTMKLMAWAVPHSYVTGMFLDSKGRFDMIPKTDPTMFPAWNAFINQQEDIRPEVKALFLFNDKGVCPYVESHRENFIFNRADNQHPEDDPPFESDDAADVDAIDLSCIEAQKQNKILDEQYKTAMENDKDPDSSNCKILMFPVPKTDEAPVEEKIDPSAEVTMKPNVEKEDINIETPMQTEEEAKSDEAGEETKKPTNLTLQELLNVDKQPIIHMLDLLAINPKVLQKARGKYLASTDPVKEMKVAEYQRMLGCLYLIEKNDYDLDKVRSHIEVELGKPLPAGYLADIRERLQDYIACFKPRAVMTLQRLLEELRYQGAGMENKCNSPPITDIQIDENVLEFLILLIETDMELNTLNSSE